MPSPCTASSHAISGKAFRWQTRSDHVTRKALAARNNEAYGQGNGRHAVVPYSPSLSLKTLVTGILLLAVFTLIRLRLACVESPPSRQTPLLRIFLRGGAALHRLSGTDNPVFKLSVEIDG